MKLFCSAYFYSFFPLYVCLCSDFFFFAKAASFMFNVEMEVTAIVWINQNEMKPTERIER